MVRFWIYCVGNVSRICFGIEYGKVENDRKIEIKKIIGCKVKFLFILIISII